MPEESALDGSVFVEVVAGSEVDVLVTSVVGTMPALTIVDDIASKLHMEIVDFMIENVQ